MKYKIREITPAGAIVDFADGAWAEVPILKTDTRADFETRLSEFASKEPVEKSNPLLKNKKVILSPHSATFTDECTSRMGVETTKNIIDFFENKLDKSMLLKLWLASKEN